MIIIFHLKIIKIEIIIIIITIIIIIIIEKKVSLTKCKILFLLI